VFYKFKEGTKLGGKHGTTVSINGSLANDIKRTAASNDTLGYESKLFSIGDNVFYQDMSLEITKKISKKTKLVVTYIYQVYDQNKIEGKNDKAQVTAHNGIVDLTQKLSTNKSIRIELQHLSTEQDKGNWAMALLEFNIVPAWSFYATDEWNYGNEHTDKQFHYYSGGLAYTQGPTRIGLSYARQRGGLLCVGGVCRPVYASNGFNIVISSRF
jgi:hypothetical protein